MVLNVHDPASEVMDVQPSSHEVTAVTPVRLRTAYRSKEIKAATIPTSVPSGYGDVLAVSFDAEIEAEFPEFMPDMVGSC